MGRARRSGSRCPPHPWVLAAVITLISLHCSLGALDTATEWKIEPSNASDTQEIGWEGHLWVSELGGDVIPSAENFQRSVLARSQPDLEPGWTGTRDSGKTSVDQGTGQAASEAKDSQPATPVDISASAVGPGTGSATPHVKSFSLGGSTLGYYPSGINKDSTGSPTCLGCPSEVDEAAEPVPDKQNQGDLDVRAAMTSTTSTAGREVRAAMTSTTSTAGREPFFLALSDTKGVAEDMVHITEGPEEHGSGDPHLSTLESVITHPESAGKEWDLRAFGERTTPPPNQSDNTGDSKDLTSEQVDQSISPDSAETDLLLGINGEAVLSSPTPGSKSAGHSLQTQSGADLGYDSEKGQQDSDLWVETTSNYRIPGSQGSTNFTLHRKEGQLVPQDVTASPPEILKSPEPPSDHPVPDIIDIDYYDLFDTDGHGGPEDFPRSPIGGPGGDSTKKLPDKKPPWALSELYDEFTPFDESDFYPTTSFYADGDEDGANEDDEDEDDIEEAEDGEEQEARARDLEDENNPKPLTFTPKIQTITQEEKPTSRQHIPQHTFILTGADVNPKSQPDTSKDLTQIVASGSDNITECRTGYARYNSSCRSVCDLFPMYCYNGGQCYLVENIGAFCRCNTQDYIWHKGMRCESIITDFQVMCVAVGTAALVVLLLFMMTVFFAKKLYLLKTENYKLRKRNRYRTPSELHNDNFSLSTIAEGSHPNVRKLCDAPCNLSPHARALAYYDNVICQEDSSAPNKLQELPKPGTKEEESFNIQNSLSPKPESDKSEQDSPEVNCLQNNLT